MEEEVEDDKEEEKKRYKNVEVKDLREVEDVVEVGDVKV